MNSKMDQVVATVNINMGEGPNNPVLQITPHTDVPAMLQGFVALYHLPAQAYDIILAKICHDLAQRNIVLPSLNNLSPSLKPLHSLSPSQRLSPSLRLSPSQENRTARHQDQQKQNNCSRYESTSRRTAKQHQNEAHARHRSTISPLRGRLSSHATNNEKPLIQRQGKVGLLRARTPLRQRDNSQTPNSGVPSNNLSRSPQRITPKRSRQLTCNLSAGERQELLGGLFESLTRNQPRTIKILSPQFVTFTGIRPAVLCLLQEFFEKIEESEFASMDRANFIWKLREFHYDKQLCQQLLKD